MQCNNMLRVVRHNNRSDTKYTINTVMIASVGTNRKAIQVHHTAMQHAAQRASKRAVLKSA